MKSYADYTHHDAADFLRDADFQTWIRRPSPELDAWWRGLGRTHPHLKPELDHARLLALGLESTWTEFSETYVEETYERLVSERLVPGLGAPLGQVRPLPVRPWARWVAAASVLLLLGLGRWGYAYFLTETTVQTAFGELRTLNLPDGSTVTLNANSRLRLPSRWAWRATREVWLDGEGYFGVTKQPSPDGGRKFTVHTTRLDVEVLGTRFNVYARPAKTAVLLDEGRVRLRDVATRRQVLMQPGQLVEYATPTRQTLRKAAPAEARSLSAYRQNLLVFDEAPLDEVAHRFGEVYGIELLFSGKEFENQRFIGELPVNDLDKALLILAETFGCRVQREGQRVVLESIVVSR